MAIEERIYTADDLWELQTLPENADRMFELIAGELIEMSPSSARPSTVAADILFLVKGFVKAHDLGWVTGADGGYELSPKNVLAADVGFVSKARQPELPERYFKLAPDLAVEVISPTDSVKAAQRKAQQYLAYGTKMVWLFYPADKTADVCLPAEGGMIIRQMGADGELDGGDALPGFKLKLADVFG